MNAAGRSGLNPRITWEQLPVTVRAGVERVLGEAVVCAQSQQGGFSPGSADRVVLASGRRAFVKAVSSGSNATAAILHRREAATTRALPPGVPAPEFLGIYDDGTWVGLVLTDIDGRHPQEPWQNSEIAQVLDALAAIARLELNHDVPLPRYEESLRGAFQGWEKLASRPVAGIDPWVGERLEELAILAKDGVVALAGNSLVHGDLRTDNILLTAHGAVFLDWPWAAIGASWVDAFSVLVNVKTLDPHVSLDSWFASHPVFAGVSDHAITCVLAGWSGYFLDMSRRPDPPGIPTLRAFQSRQAGVLISWLRQRLS